MNRRQYIVALAGITSLAGCSGSSDGSDGNGGSGGDDQSTDQTTEPDLSAAESATESTQEPSTESTETDTPTPVQELAPIEFSGEGRSVTDRFTVEGGFTVFEMAHQGSSNFQVELIHGQTGETVDYLANEIGSWEAWYPTGVESGDYVLDVNADGQWSITVRQPRPSEDEAISVPITASGQYPDYIGPIHFQGLVLITGEYDGDSNFAVWVLGTRGGEADLLFNEIGTFEGETTFGADGYGWIRVEATGPWSLTIEGS